MSKKYRLRLIAMKNDHNYHESKRFLIIPNPEDNEFILSYLFRLK